MVDATIFDLLLDYIEVYGRPRPIKYDILNFGEDHRKFDALIRRYWSNLHPLTRDLFTSFANEFQFLLHEIEKAEERVQKAEENKQQIADEYNHKWLELDQKFDNMVTDKVSEIKSKQFDEISRENKALTAQNETLTGQVRDQKEINKNLRQELSLFIDDSDNTEKSKQELEANISDSLKTFSIFTEQLDMLEIELSQITNEGENKDLLIKDLQADLEQKNQDLANSKLKYQELFGSLKDLNPKFNNLKMKLKELEEENANLKDQQVHIQPSVRNFSNPSDIDTQTKALPKPKIVTKTITEKRLRKPPNLLTQISNQPGPSPRSKRETDRQLENIDPDPFELLRGKKEKSVRSTMINSIKSLENDRTQDKINQPTRLLEDNEYDQLKKREIRRKARKQRKSKRRPQRS